MDKDLYRQIDLDDLQEVPFENNDHRKYGFSAIIIVGLIGIAMIFSKAIPIILSDVIIPYFITTEPKILRRFIYPILSEISLIIIPCFTLKFFKSDVAIYDFANSIPNNYLKAFLFIIIFSILSFALISKEKCEEVEPLENIADLLLYLFSNCFFPAFCEEFVFRGWAFHFLKENMPQSFAVILTSLIFALCHSHRSLFSYFLIFILSILWNYSNISTESIFVSIFSHFFHNFLQTVFLLIFPQVCDMNPRYSFGLWIFSCFILLLLIDF